MPYIAPDDLRAVLARDLTPLGQGLETGTAADLSDVQLANAIDTAQALIDASVANRYSVPFPDPAPKLIVQLTKVIGAYQAEMVYRQSVDIADEDPMQRMFVWAQSVLTSLGGGNIDLPDLAPTSQDKPSTSIHNMYSGQLFWPKLFGLDDGTEGRWTSSSGQW
jgi:phage gp36-like protein